MWLTQNILLPLILKKIHLNYRIFVMNPKNFMLPNHNQWWLIISLNILNNFKMIKCHFLATHLTADLLQSITMQRWIKRWAKRWLRLNLNIVIQLSIKMERMFYIHVANFILYLLVLWMVGFIIQIWCKLCYIDMNIYWLI